MVFIVGINLAVIVVAIIATTLFSNLAVEKGYVASKARKYTIFVSCAALFLMMMGQTLINFIVNMMQTVNASFAEALVYGWSLLILLLCVTVLYKAYQNIKKAPDAGAVKK